MAKSLLNSVKKIVKKSAKFALMDDIEITEKGSVTNIVTNADVAVQKYLEEKLLKLLPGSSFMGEESDNKIVQTEYCWIVDPLDGTQNFARHMDQTGISVGLRKGSEIILGVIYNPFLKEMYWAEKGKGAFLNGRQIHVSNKPFNNSIFCTAMSTYNKDYAKTCNDIIMDVYYRCNDVRRFGVCSLELCYIADGRCDLYYEFRLYPWDYAAATIILREAGGCIMSPFDEEPSTEHPCPIIAANNKENLDILKSYVRKYMKDIPYLI